MNLKKVFALMLVLAAFFTLASCRGGGGSGSEAGDENITLEIYAPLQTIDIMPSIAQAYKDSNPKVSIVVTYDEGAVLAAKIEAGYSCDIYIADEAKFMNWLDINSAPELNPNKNDKIVSDSRKDFMKGPGNADYAPETPGEGETYVTTYSAALCKTTGKPYEAGRFIEFLLGEKMESVYEEYGYSLPDTTAAE